MIRVVQTYTVGFDGPFRSLLVTLLPDAAILGKPDFRSRTLIRRRTHSELGYLPICPQKYTVLYLELIRSLLDPFQVSHTIIGTSDSFRLPRTHSGLPGLGLSPEILPKVHGRVPWVNPFTIRPFPVIPHYYWDVGRPGRVSGSIPTTASLSRTGWPVSLHTGYQSSQLIPECYIYICIYISQRKYISNFTTIHALSPYRSSHTITPATCVYIGLILKSITSIVCVITYDSGYLSFTIHRSNIH